MIVSQQASLTEPWLVVVGWLGVSSVIATIITMVVVALRRFAARPTRPARLFAVTTLITLAVIGRMGVFEEPTARILVALLLATAIVVFARTWKHS